MSDAEDTGMKRRGDHLSRLAMSRLLAGELSDAEGAAMESHVRTCASCSTTYKAAGEAARDFSGKYPTLEYLEATRRSRRNPSASPTPLWTRIAESFRGLGGMRPVLASLMVLATAGALIWMQPADLAQPDLSSKGGIAGATFHLFVNGRHIQGDTAACGPGDTLQLGITSPSPVHFAVLYKDDAGEIKTYMDGKGGPLGDAKGENLPNSLILDSSWSRELLFCLWSARPFDAYQAKARAAAFLDPSTSAGEGGDLRVRAFVLMNSRP